MRVLYVSHTAAVSGAEHSLLVILRAGAGRIAAVLACPEGELATAARRAGVPVHVIPGTDLSARLHPWHTAAGVVRAARSAWRIRAIARAAGADVIHANTPRAALLSLLARGRDGARPVVHLRDGIPPGRLPRLLYRLLAARTSGFVPTTAFLARQLPDGWPAVVVPNAVERERFDPDAVDRAQARARLGIAPAAPVLSIVGQISPHKGQSDAIEILAAVRRRHSEAVLLVVGTVKFTSSATRFDNHGYAAELEALARRRGLAGAVRFLGERAEVADVLAAVDVALVPSWYEPFGRVALEAMMMRIPVVVTAVGGVAEVVVDGEDGLVLAPRRPAEWADAVSALLGDPARRAAMGASGRRRALTYAPDRHVDALLAVYRDLTTPTVPRLAVAAA
jgi:glycosyltransferase involved in cell wall biosynthesis